ncbi:TRAF-type zinc finger domain-containing protein 1-like [Polyodon spathula]|uniref:TRAF-type zinc finger domain-containing protein 1-like n=1 Tax=Polyodon spathula TaxID=7913 RepID=UPI001B7DCD7D|nr:TRAF-type zinc finger domain-containing protein 1-like [Polyodon spathula]XP_041095912.1 TRAF-type zinc finger domain-containing protein 1-like [Polyodon spathula]
MSEESTQLCANCKRDIPSVNFTIHEIHCRRNISLCQYCKESFPRSEMEEHVELEHAQVACKCGMKMEKRHVEKHELSECGLRLKKCQFCDLELAFKKWGDHEEYCGARTEPCPQCLRNVMVKELSTHPAVCGTQPAEERNNNRGRMGTEELLPGVWFEAHAIRNLLQGEAVRNSNRPPGLRVPRPLESRVHNSTWAAGAALRGQEKRNTPARNRNQNQVAEEEGFQRNCRGQTGVEGGGDENSNLDYLLALSLQDENCDYTRGQGTWADQWGDRLTQIADPLLFPDRLTELMQPPVPTVSRNNNPIERNTDDAMLPCEFCEKLFPEEDLILHQTGCNPTSAFASFSKRPPSPLQEDSLFTESPSPFYSSQHLTSKFASLSYGPPPGPAEGTVVIPCEFCGVLLEDDVLFHHQDKCDLRPGTACPTERPSARETLPPKVENRRKNSPEIQRRQVRQHGELGSAGLEYLIEKPRNQDIPAGVKPLNGTPNSRDPWKPESRTGPLNPVKVINTSNRERRGPGWREPAVGVTPTSGTRTRFPEGYEPNSPQASSGRQAPGARTEERRNFRGSVTTKPHIPKVRDVEKEE